MLIQDSCDLPEHEQSVAIRGETTVESVLCSVVVDGSEEDDGGIPFVVNDEFQSAKNCFEFSLPDVLVVMIRQFVATDLSPVVGVVNGDIFIVDGVDNVVIISTVIITDDEFVVGDALVHETECFLRGVSGDEDDSC